MKIYSKAQRKSWQDNLTTREILGPWKYIAEPVHDFVQGPALYYEHGLCIEFVEDQYYLCIGNEEWISEDLCFLEEILAEFSISNGQPPYMMYEIETKCERIRDKVVDQVMDHLVPLVNDLDIDDLKILDKFDVGRYVVECLIDNINGSK